MIIYVSCLPSGNGKHIHVATENPGSMENSMGMAPSLKSNQGIQTWDPHVRYESVGKQKKFTSEIIWTLKTWENHVKPIGKPCPKTPFSCFWFFFAGINYPPVMVGLWDWVAHSLEDGSDGTRSSSSDPTIMWAPDSQGRNFPGKPPHQKTSKNWWVVFKGGWKTIKVHGSFDPTENMTEFF